MKLKLENVTLLGIDCVDASRLQKVMDLCEEKIFFAKSKILSSDYIDDKRWVKIGKISSYEDFSKFCLSDLKKYVETEFVLLIQWDGFVLNPNSWTNDFLDYDYIGSPWIVKDWSIYDFGFPENLRNTRIVGNGGFCIRSRKFLEVSSRMYLSGVFKTYHPEDIALCVWYRDLLTSEGIRFAPVELARRFALEGDDDIYDKQFGFHGLYTNLDKWMEENKNHPEIFKSYQDFKKKVKKYWKPDKIVI
ncbi:MAG: hypothetical protein AB201_02030 [Parcubacteria bacterium C7867-006]|nr:MAG: hypothetical protein AB201_02030 [Parcubacteria bacterium C7867-006]